MRMDRDDRNSKVLLEALDRCDLSFRSTFVGTLDYECSWM